MVSQGQLRAVAASCSYYNGDSFTSSASNVEVSCETCKNWTGKKCKIDVFDSVLTGLDQS